jgi:hypothetical protein
MQKYTLIIFLIVHRLQYSLFERAYWSRPKMRQYLREIRQINLARDGKKELQ